MVLVDCYKEAKEKSALTCELKLILYAMWLSFLRLFHELACQADKGREADDADEQGRFAERTDVAEMMPGMR